MMVLTPSLKDALKAKHEVEEELRGTILTKIRKHLSEYDLEESIKKELKDIEVDLTAFPKRSEIELAQIEGRRRVIMARSQDLRLERSWNRSPKSKDFGR